MEKGCNICFGPSSLYEDKVKHQKIFNEMGASRRQRKFIFTIHNVSFNKIQESSKIYLQYHFIIHLMKNLLKPLN